MNRQYIPLSLTNTMLRKGVEGMYFFTFSAKNAIHHSSLVIWSNGNYTISTTCSFTGKERDEETGYSYFGARYYDADLQTSWLSVDPMSDKYPSRSPYAYCAWDPVKLVDPDGNAITDFQDKNGNLIMHVEDGSNAVYRLVGNNLTDEYFAFVGFSEQGGSNEISFTGLIAGAQEYALDNHIYCNQAVNFVGRSYVNTYDDAHIDVNSGNMVSKNLSATDIMNGLHVNNAPYFKKDDANSLRVKQEARSGAFVVGVTKGHVCMVSTLDYEVTKYMDGRLLTYKHVGGRTININGGTTNGRGPNKNNSSYDLKYAYVDGWYSLKPFAYELKQVDITQ